MRNIILVILCFGTLFVSCEKKTPDANRVLVAKVLDSFLYLDEMEEFVPKNVSKEDSIAHINEYIRAWSTDVLMYEKAKQNIADFDEIERLVEEYRKILILTEYKQKLVQQRYSTEEQERELLQYYESYKEHLLLKESVIQGILLVVPKDAPELKKLATWIEKADKESIENIEKYSLRNAISYDYFMENWIPLSDVLKNTAFTLQEVEEQFSSKKSFITKDEVNHYFLSVVAARAVGDIEPYELVRDKIVTILATKQKSDIILKVKNKMYNEAQEKGEIKIY